MLEVSEILPTGRMKWCIIMLSSKFRMFHMINASIHQWNINTNSIQNQGIIGSRVTTFQTDFDP